jgi:NAD(P)H-quinone oxidoreductase subunit 5
MFDDQLLLDLLGRTVVIVPLLLVVTLGLPSLAGRPLSERLVSGLVQAAMIVGLLATCGVLALMLATGTRHVPIDFGNWVELSPDVPAELVDHTAKAEMPAHSQFHFALKFVFDRLSVPFAILTFLLCGVVGAFASRYLHREPGFNRFFICFALFVLGMVLTTIAGTIETLFTGWELVGVSSALLAAYFHERPAPVINGLQIWSVYRLSDAALLLAAVVLHHLRGAGDFAAVLGVDPWPLGQADVTPPQALLVGSLLLVAAAGKSALVPFSGWLPRAMEGPTPSSAIFYGALSVHLGTFLLLRISPILEQSLLLSAAVVLLGLVTAVFAALAGRVQTDIKSALCFASLTQVGLIVVEIGLGLRYIALIHMLGHACLRTLQFLRAPTLLHDYHTLENATGGHLSPSLRVMPLTGAIPAPLWLYRLAIERGYFDVVLGDYVAQPLLRALQVCDTLERRWTRLLSREAAPPSETRGPSVASLEDAT